MLFCVHTLRVPVVEGVMQVTIWQISITFSNARDTHIASELISAGVFPVMITTAKVQQVI